MDQTTRDNDAIPAWIVDDELLSAMAERGQPQKFEPGQILIREGEEADSLYILVRGRVKVYAQDDRGREVIYNVLDRGEFFGEMFLDGGNRSASVVALEPSSVIVVPADELRTFIVAHPEFAFRLVVKLVQLVRHSTEHIKSLALDDVYRRTVRILQSLVSPEGDRWVAREPITQTEVASRVGATREMINRIFRHLTRNGYMTKDNRRRIVILKPLPKDW